MLDAWPKEIHDTECDGIRGKIQETFRSASRLFGMNLLTNLRYTFRQIAKQPGFFALAVAALALGIGANTAIFSAVEAVLLRPLPYSHPDRLAVVWEDASYVGFPNNTPAPANYLDWQARNQVFTDMLATRFDTASLTGDGQPEQLSGKKVTPNFFDVLGVQPVVGRPFTVEEDKSQTPVVVLGYNLSRRRFGGDESIIGRSILMNGVRTKVVGVMPQDFFFQDRKNSDYWVPMAFTPEQWARRQTHFLTVVARLMTESLMLSVVGGFLGLWVGQACWSVLGQIVPEQAGDGFAINGPLLLFTAGISIAAGILFGLAPALRSSSVPLQESLKEGGRGGESRGGLRLRDTLVVGQFALAFALLVCAGLMIQTIWNLRKQELGFQADHLLTMEVPLA